MPKKSKEDIGQEEIIPKPKPSLLDAAKSIKSRPARKPLLIDEEMIELFQAYVKGDITTGQVEQALKIPQGSRIYSWAITVARHLAQAGRLKITKS